MTIASGTEKVVGLKRETTAGTIAGATGAQLLQRVNLNIALKKDAYSSARKTSIGMKSDMRHGVRRVLGTLEDELAPGATKLAMEAVLRKDFATGATTGAITTVAAAAGPPGTFTRSSGSFFTDGFKVGDWVRWTGWTTTGVNNNTRNYQITALTALIMTVRGTNNEVVAAKAAGDSVTCSVVGKKSYVPNSGRTDYSHTIEEWYADVAQSERYVGCKFSSMKVSIQPTGMATIAYTIVGLDLQTGTSVYFTSPTAVVTTGILAAVNGTLRIAATDIAVLTGLEFTLDWGTDGQPVVGSNVLPGLTHGGATLTGSFQAFFEDATLRDLFIDETEASLQFAMTTNNTITADFLAFIMPRIKVNDAAKADAATGITQTFPFESLYDSTGAATTGTDATILSIQDSSI
jgi:hypothetical protein